MKKAVLLFLALAMLVPAPGQPGGDKQAVDYVDPLMGTTFARWMLFPGASRPFGMVKLSPDNQRKGWKAGYEYKIHNISGFSHLHSWTMGGLLTMPAVGPLKITPGWEYEPDNGYRSRFSHDNEVARPGYYSVFLDDYGIKAELTSTTRAGFQRYTFPESDSARILVDLQIPTEYGFELFEARITKISGTEIEGYTRQQSLRGAGFNEFKLHFVMRFSKAFETFNGWLREEVYRDTSDIWLLFGDHDIGAFLEFRTAEGEEILVQSGISLVSIDQARLNLETELDPFNWDFDLAVQDSREEWNSLLASIEVEGGSETDKKKFYTNMYRAYASRTIWSDVNGKYVDMYEQVQQLDDPEDPVYGCDAFWNTFWNLNQLWTLSQPGIASKWVKSLLEIYDKGGWLPKGPTGIEYSSIMVASHEIPLMVSAYQKGIRDYDVEKMYEAIRHCQTTPGILHEGGGRVGNRNLTSYLELGYVPTEKGPVSSTLEYAYDDWAVGQMAKALGKTSDYKTFMKRSLNYRNVFYPEEGYVWMKNADGTWVENFTRYGHSTFFGPGFVEGNAWQYTYFVPHDLAGLIDLLGRDEFNDRLQEGFLASQPHRFNSEHLHENGLIGVGILPINHGNQPNMQAAYLFNYGGKPWLTQYWAREIMDGFYGDGIDAWPGDEDQGQMGAWYVMSAMGLFQMDGGASVKPFYEIGSPIFEKITIHLDPEYYPGGNFVIEARGTSKENRYVQSAKLDGQELSRPWFYHSDLVDGGSLVLEMGPEPNEDWGSEAEDAPPSLSSSLSAEEIREVMSYDKFAEDMELWNKGIKAYYFHRKEHFESLPDTEGEIIFLGNSISDQCEWAELFGDTRIKNRGIGGDDTDGVLERLDEVTASGPSKIFLLIGTNDLSFGKDVPYVLKNIGLILDRIKSDSPETMVYLQSILPVDDGIHYTRDNNQILEINRELPAMARDRGYTYVDLHPAFRNEAGILNPDYSYDGLHLNGKGYLHWKELIDDLVRN